MPFDLITQAKNGNADSTGSDTIIMQTWDFAGQDMYYSMAHVFLTTPAVYVLALDLAQWAGPWIGPPNDS
eukprot:4316094-Amphidinium_carterae.1